MQYHIYGGFWESYELDIIKRSMKRYHNHDRRGKPWILNKVPVLGDPLRGFHYCAWRSDWDEQRMIIQDFFQWMIESIDIYYRDMGNRRKLANRERIIKR